MTKGDDVIELPQQHQTEAPIIKLRRSTRIINASRQRSQDTNIAVFKPIQEVANLLMMEEHQPLLDEIMHRTYLAAGEKNHNDSRFFSAKKKELDSMFENKVWELVPLPAGARAIAVSLSFRQTLSGLTTAQKASLIVLG